MGKRGGSGKWKGAGRKGVRRGGKGGRERDQGKKEGMEGDEKEK